MELHKIVKKLQKKMGKIITLHDIAKLVDPISDERENSTARISQVIYALKGQGILQMIRNGLYLVSDGKTSGTDIIDLHYWSIVRTMIRSEIGRDAIIGGEKALELLMMDFSLPESLIVYTRETNKKIILAPGHEIVFRTMATGKKNGKGSAFHLLKKQSTSIEVSGIPFVSLGYESALLDTLTIHDHQDGISDALVLKFLKRYAHRLDREKLAILVKTRYIRAINRLRSLTRDHGYPELYQITLDIIKKEGGGCFVSL